jgi:hypothetical protein
MHNINNNYNEYILKGILLDSWGELTYQNALEEKMDLDEIIIEAEVLIQCQDYRLKCFVYDMGEKHFSITPRWIKNRIGKELKFELYFCNYGPIDKSVKSQFIKDITPKEHSNQYHIGGKVILKLAVLNNARDEFILDCGLPVNIEAEPGQYSIGDFLEVIGRMDIQFV